MAFERKNWVGNFLTLTFAIFLLLSVDLHFCYVLKHIAELCHEEEQRRKVEV